MEQFVVSARKYRPSTFDTVVGQEAITTTIKNAIKSNHLAQAFLFSGPRGVGKTTCARILAKAINCQNLTSDFEPCDECESCVSFRKGNSLNIFELDAASNNSVEDIRELIDQVKFPPLIGKYKVYIIDEVHMLSTSAFNAFLKTLEEPPSYAIFILATTEKHKVLPTILSRCQLFDFSRIQVEDIAKHLAKIASLESIQCDPEALHMIAQKADGGLRDSLSMFDQLVTFSGNNLTYQAVLDNLNILDYQYYFKLTEHLMTEQLDSALILFDEILNKGFDGHQFVAGFSSHIRDLLMCKNPSTLKLIQHSAGVKEQYLQQSKACTVFFLSDTLEHLSKADAAYKQSRNPRLSVEIALMKIALINSEAEKKNSSSEVSSKPSSPAPNVAAPVQATESRPAPTSYAPTSNASPEPTTPKTVSEPIINRVKKPFVVPGGNSISEVISSAAKPEATEENNEEDLLGPQANTAGVSVGVSEILFNQAWLEAIQIAKDNIRMDIAALLSFVKPVVEGEKIKVVLSNEVQNRDLIAYRAELIPFLREKLNNNRLYLDIELNLEQVDSHRPYTNKEKFDYMAEKNPNLLDIKNKLNLELL